MSDLDRAIAAMRRAVMLHEREASTSLTQAYSDIQQRLAADLARLTRDIADAQARGETVDANWLRRSHRYQTLIAQTQTEIDAYGQYAQGVITQAQRQAVASALAASEAVMGAALGPSGVPGVAVNFNRLNTGAVEHLVGALSDGSPLSALLDGIGAEASAAGRTALLEGIGKGMGPRALAREFRRGTGVSAVRALTISRNEVNRSFRSAALENYKANRDVLEGWTWVCAGSRRTCAACYAKHGSVHKVDERFSSHVCCRCTPVPKTKSWEELGFKGIPDTRPTIPDRDELFGQLSAEDQRAVLGPGKHELWSNGTPLTAFATATRSARWGAGIRETTLAEAQAIPVKVIGPGTFGTTADALAWAEKAYPQIRWKLAGAHPDALNPMLQQFDQLMQDWPAVGRSIRRFEVNARGIPASAFAQADVPKGLLQLNPRQMGDPQKVAAMLRDYRESIDSGWVVDGGGLEGIITHEFGHFFGIPQRFYETYTPTAALSEYAITDKFEGMAEGFVYYTQHEGSWISAPPYVKALRLILDEMKGRGR